MEMDVAINNFVGQYSFLPNFRPTNVESVCLKSLEHTPQYTRIGRSE